MGALQKVFVQWKYVALSAMVAIAIFAFSVWLPNWKLIYTVFTAPSVSFFEAISVVLGLFLSIGTNFTIVSASYTIVIAILFGVNVSLLTYYITRKRGAFGTGGVLGAGGLVSGVFGVGCASCGTFILTSLLTFVGVGGLLTMLPLKGEEFGILGVALIGYATYWTMRKIEEPLLVCDV
tara:strand:- start:9139 stop:9675 length:537 start_codon:yes stop_codon:yes gene_type:complete